jgi:RHS repeat-associated protein
MYRRLRLLVVATVFCAVALPLAVVAQIPNLTASTATPLPAAGHACLSAQLPSGAAAAQVFGGAVAEYVNPATGAVNWSICASVPQGRQLSLPFCFAYHSAGVHHLESNGPGELAWNSDATYLEQGGWSYTLPALSEVVRQDVNGAYQCDYATDYVFRDSRGGRHALHVSITGPAPGAPANSCSETAPTRTAATSGGEGAILATTAQPAGSFAVTPVTVTDADGTRYVFNQPAKEAGLNGFAAELPDLIEDRNGNQISLADAGAGAVSVSDTVGRTLVGINGFGQATGDSIQISGQSQPYAVTWGTAAADYTVDAAVESGACSAPTNVSRSQPVITALTLPDGQAFRFEYDPVYGLLQKISFPTGGYVRYVWGMNGEAEEGTFDGPSGTCSVRYGEPAVVDRYVSLDGSSEVLDQSLAYATTWGAGAGWTAKTTTLTNHDLSRNQNFETDYSYSGYSEPAQPNDDTVSTLQIPVEQTIIAKDWSGAVLRTTAEAWNNPRELASRQVTESDGEVSLVTFAYDGNEQQTEKDEYDYGAGAPGALQRVTLHSYGCASGVHIVDRPTLVEIESGSRQRTAETDYGYDQSPLAAGGATAGRDAAYAAGGGITARCNLTTLTRYNDTGDIVERFTFDDAGNRLTHVGGNGNTTSYAYDPSLQAAYVTLTTLPQTTTGGRIIAHSRQTGYDLASGRVTSRSDVQNATTTSYVYNDPLDRLTETDYPDGGKTTLTYAANSLETRRLRTGSTWTDHFDHWGGLGDVDRAMTYSGSTWDTVDTSLDGEQLPAYVSYPYFSSGLGSAKATSNAAAPGDTASFDALGRRTSTTRSDGGMVTVAYSGPDATITDAAGRSRKEEFDALGRLAAVLEYTDTQGDYYATYYGYGTLDDLKSVTQGSETRNFDYDNLNRLVDATNPETGTVSYVYDNNNNLISQQQANGTVVTYFFDALNRLRARSYAVQGATAATPAVQIDYDTDSTRAPSYYAYGRMTRVISAKASIGMDQYDPAGRLETYDTTLGGNTYYTSLRFDYLGDPVWESLPDGRKLGMSPDAEGRANWLGDDSSGLAFTHYRNYSPAGGLTEEELGNGLVEDVNYNGRLQPTEITVRDPNDASDSTWRMDLVIAYTQAGIQTADNGNVVGLTDKLGNSGQSYTMTYDQLNRLAVWSAGGGTDCRFAIDRYGNLNLSNGSGCGMLSGIGFNENNQIVGYGYDPSGLLLSDTSGSSYTWDGNNQLVAFSAPGASGGYVYDGLLRRVEKTSDSTTTLYARDALGHVAASLTGGVWTDYAWASPAGAGNRNPATPGDQGVRIAAAIGTGVGDLQFFHADQVGTTRVVTDQNGANLAACGQNAQYSNGSFLTYGPFGTPEGCTQSATAVLFTGHELDSESGLDQFQYRKYSPLQGRWATPDPAGINGPPTPAADSFGHGAELAGLEPGSPPASLETLPGFGLPLGAAAATDPQSWNPYAYAGGAPASYFDPDGRMRACVAGRIAQSGLIITGAFMIAFGGSGLGLMAAGWYLGGALDLACGWK